MHSRRNDFDGNGGNNDDDDESDDRGWGTTAVPIQGLIAQAAK
jgi:hypothetical protein